MTPKTKVVEIEGQRYQIRKLPPDVGSYLLMRMIGAGIKGDQDEPITPAPTNGRSQELRVPDGEEMARAVIFAAFLRGIDFETHKFVQQAALAACARLEGDQDLPMPLATNGRLIETVAENMPLVIRLEVEVLSWNFSDFFAGGGLNALAGQTSQA